MSDNEEDRAATAQVAAPQNSPAGPATQSAHHSMAGPKDIRMHAFTTDTDPDETGRRWKKWKNELLTRFRYFRISNIQDRADALHIYGGEQIRELIESLEDVPLASPSTSGELNEFDKTIAKLDNHFLPLVNPDCARSKLDKMCQKEGESIAQYHVRLRLQVAKCSYADPDDAVRSKILQTMRDKKLRREAMVKRYTLQQLLEHAANKEDIDRQAHDMEKALTSETVPVNKVYEKRHHNPKGKRNKKKPPLKQSEDNGNICQYCGFDHEGPRSKCPDQGKRAPLAPRKVILPKCAKGKRKTKINKRKPSQQPNQSSQNKTARQTPILLFNCRLVVHAQAAHPLFMS